MTSPPILTYLSKAHQANPEAEVAGVELQRELGLDAATVKACVAQLAREGLVEWDPLLANIWLRITDKGLAAAGRWAPGPMGPSTSGGGGVA